MPNFRKKLMRYDVDFLESLYHVPRPVVTDSVSCSFCGASQGVTCLGVLRQSGKRRIRTTPHKERYIDYADALEIRYGYLDTEILERAHRGTV